MSCSSQSSAPRAAAFVGVGGLARGDRRARAAGTTGLALALLVLGSAVRANAAVGGHVPALAHLAVVAAALLYSLPALGWFFARCPACAAAVPRA